MRGPAAVDEDPLAGDVATGVAGEEEEGTVEILGLPVAGEQGVAQDPVLHLWNVDDLSRHLRFDEPRRQAVGADAVPPPLEGPFAGEGIEPPFDAA